MVCANCRGERSVSVNQQPYCADCGKLLSGKDLTAAAPSSVQQGARAHRQESAPIIQQAWIAKLSLVMAALTGLAWLIIIGWLMPYTSRWGLAAVILLLLVWAARSWVKNTLTFGLMHSVNNRPTDEEGALKSGLHTLSHTLPIDLVTLVAVLAMAAGFYAVGLSLSQSGVNAIEAVGLALGLLVLIWFAASLCAIYPLATIAANLSHLKATKSVSYAWHLYEHHLDQLVATAFETLWARTAMVMALILCAVGLATALYKLPQGLFIALGAGVAALLVLLEYLSTRRNLLAWILAYKSLAEKNGLYPTGKLLAGSPKDNSK